MTTKVAARCLGGCFLHHVELGLRGNFYYQAVTLRIPVPGILSVMGILLHQLTTASVCRRYAQNPKAGVLGVLWFYCPLDAQ